MYRSLLNTFPTLGVFALIMGVVTLVALVVAMAIRALYPNIADSHYGAATGAIKGTFGLLYGLIFALSIGDLSVKSDAASSTAAAESVTLAQMVQATGAMPVQDRIPARRAIREYTRAVVEDEWKTLQEGKPSVRTSTALDNMLATYQSYVGKPAPTGSIASAGLSKIDSVVASRRTRLDLSQQGLPGLLRALLIIGVIMFIALSFPSEIGSRNLQLLVMGGIAAFLAFAFSLTVILDYPFSGGASVKNNVYKQGILAQFFATGTPPTPVEDLDVVKPTAKDIVGEWTSAVSKNGVIIFREVGDEIHGVYRADNGSFVGQIDDDGVFRGWWCEEPSRKVPEDAGQVEWRLVETKEGAPLKLDGRWMYGEDGIPTSGWGLEKVGPIEPVDLAAGFDDPARFCPRPASPAERSSASTTIAPTTTTTTTAPRTPTTRAGLGTTTTVRR